MCSVRPSRPMQLLLLLMSASLSTKLDSIRPYIPYGLESQKQCTNASEQPHEIHVAVSQSTFHNHEQHEDEIHETERKKGGGLFEHERFLELNSGIRGIPSFHHKYHSAAFNILNRKKPLEIVHQERRGQVKTIVMEHFNDILFHKSGLANKQHTNHLKHSVANQCIGMKNFYSINIPLFNALSCPGLVVTCFNASSFQLILVQWSMRDEYLVTVWNLLSQYHEKFGKLLICSNISGVKCQLFALPIPLNC